MEKLKIPVIFALLAFICTTGCFVYYFKTYLKAQSVDSSFEAGVEELPPFVETVTVYVCGEVNNEGLYTLEAGSRVQDAVEAAGGLTESADLERAESLAKKLEDEQKIYIPNTNDDIDKLLYIKDNSSVIQNRTKKDSDAVVNINTANIEELTLIPGIGEVTANAILEYRELFGSFSSIEEIKNVTGIGEKTYESIKNNITVN